MAGLVLAACSDSPTDANEPFLGCANVGSIQTGTRVSGALETADCRESAGALVDLYELRLASSTTVEITLSSGSFDTYLVLLERETGAIRAQNNDIDIFTTDSRIRAPVPAGRYVIVATSYRVGEEGPYRLSAEPAL